MPPLVKICLTSCKSVYIYLYVTVSILAVNSGMIRNVLLALIFWSLILKELSHLYHCISFFIMPQGIQFLLTYSYINILYCAQSLSCVWLCGPVDYSLPGSSVHGIIQATILEWVATSFSRGSSQARGQNCISCVSCIGKWVLYH